MTIDCTDQKNYYKSLLRLIFDCGGASLMASPYRAAVYKATISTSAKKI